MAAPVTPFTTPTLAAYLAKNMFRGQVPGANTPINATEMTQLITWVDSMLEGDFRSVGYRVPFVEISGETWPTQQTTWLQFMSSIGAIAMSSGYVLAPAPAMSVGRVQGQMNPFWILIDNFRNGIQQHGFRFRAQFYLGTKAEKWLSDPQGPRTDFEDDLYDMTRYQGLRAFTDYIDEAFKDILDYDIDFDHVYAFRTPE